MNFEGSGWVGVEWDIKINQREWVGVVYYWELVGLVGF
jgi:hypothetical protein